MKIQIKSRYTNAVLFEPEHEENSLKRTVEEAVRQKVSLAEADFQNVSLMGADLKSGDFRGVDFSGARFFGVNLRNAKFCGVNLRSVTFHNSSFRSADFSAADLSGASFSGDNELEHVNFDGALGIGPNAGLKSGIEAPHIRTLNEAFFLDPAAFTALVNNRVPCNAALAYSPFVVVETPERPDRPMTSFYTVGALGVVNAVLAANGLPRVAAVFDAEGRLTGFSAYNPAPTEEE